MVNYLYTTAYSCKWDEIWGLNEYLLIFMIVELFLNVLIYICQVGMESEGFAIYDAMMRMKAEVLYIYYLQLISSI